MTVVDNKVAVVPFSEDAVALDLPPPKSRRKAVRP